MLQMSTALTTRTNQVPGFFSYIQKPNQNSGPDTEQFQLIQLEQLDDAIYTPVSYSIQEENRCSSCKRKLKSDLPLTSDFGEINSPYELVYARLEGLQYR